MNVMDCLSVHSFSNIDVMAKNVKYRDSIVAPGQKNFLNATDILLSCIDNSSI